MALTGLLFIATCSSIPEIDDPVIGIWSQTTIENAGPTEKKTVRNEWIFNDVYLGRYHQYEGNELVIQNDYSWTIENGTYTLEYPGSDIPSSVLVMKTTAEGKTILADTNDNIVAIRE